MAEAVYLYYLYLLCGITPAVPDLFLIITFQYLRKFFVNSKTQKKRKRKILFTYILIIQTQAKDYREIKIDIPTCNKLKPDKSFQ